MSATTEHDALGPQLERHDDDEPAVCVGQWCCGCVEHPIGKPWGWNSEAWGRHYATHSQEDDRG